MGTSVGSQHTAYPQTPRAASAGGLKPERLWTRSRSARRFAPTAAYLVDNADACNAHNPNTNASADRFELLRRNSRNAFNILRCFGDFDVRDLSLEIRFANLSCNPRSWSVDLNRI